MEVKTIDLFILLTIEKHKNLDLKQLSIKLMVDQSEISKSLNRLINNNLILSDNTRPKKYYLNNEIYKKWIKN